nr:MAG TPA: hypothetical protein [Bacteriophage sp.]
MLMTDLFPTFIGKLENQQSLNGTNNLNIGLFIHSIERYTIFTINILSRKMALLSLMDTSMMNDHLNKK